MARNTQGNVTTTRKVLIVEDEALIALDLKSRLQRANYTVVGVADSMDEAITLVEKKSPDLVLMDIRIRGAHDGIETAGLIRKRYDIPVIFVTAYADRETLERAKLTEPFGYIMKPIVNVDFQAQVETVLWKHAMERKLRDSEAWLAATLRNVGNAMIAADAEGNVVFMNPLAEQLTGWTTEAARSQHLMEVLALFDEKTGLPMINPLAALYDGREPAPLEEAYHLVNREGDRTALVEASVSANRRDGQLLGVIVILQDVTTRRQKEAEAKQIQKTEALSSLASGISHDLEQRLSVIQMAVQSIDRTTSLDPVTAQTLRQVERASRSAQNLVEQLSLLGKSDFRLQSIDLGHLLEGLSAALRKKLGRTRDLKLELAAGLPHIRADQEALSRVILNLVSESREAMPDGGVVEILAEPCGDGAQTRAVQLTVSGFRAGRCGRGPRRRLSIPMSSRAPIAHNAGTFDDTGAPLAWRSAAGPWTFVRRPMPVPPS